MCISDLKKALLLHCDPCWPSNLHLEHYQSLWLKEESKVDLDLTIRVSPQKPHSLIHLHFPGQTRAICASHLFPDPLACNSSPVRITSRMGTKYEWIVIGMHLKGYVVARLWKPCADVRAEGLKEQSLPWRDGQKVATRGALEGDAAKEEVSHGALEGNPGTHGMRELFCMTKSTGLKVCWKALFFGDSWFLIKRWKESSVSDWECNESYLQAFAGAEIGSFVRAQRLSNDSLYLHYINYFLYLNGSQIFTLSTDPSWYQIQIVSFCMSSKWIK